MLEEKDLHQNTVNPVYGVRGIVVEDRLSLDQKLRTLCCRSQITQSQNRGSG